jgi:RHS repeat-associated protein
MRISSGRAEMLRHDPHVVSVLEQGRHLKPQPNGSGNMVLGNYGYDGSGNITAIGQDVYAYDALSRLTSATAEVTNSQTYTYDAFGNRLTAPSTGGLCTGDTTCGQSETYDANNHLTNNGALYDPAGNLIAYAADKYAYDAAGMLSRSLVTGFDKQYLYTAGDERVAVYDGVSNWRWTVRDEDGKVLREFTSTNTSSNSLGNTAPQWVRDYIWRDGLLLVTENRLPTGGEATYHYHLDHLGTPRLVTDGNGVKVATHTYHAFGAELKKSPEVPETPIKFTGHERDITGSSDALDDMHARYYSPIGGRFLSPDPVLSADAMTSPQLWNRYAYVGNNPMSRVDPTGKILTFFGSSDDLDKLKQIANSGLHGYQLQIGKNGVASLQKVKATGKETKEQAALRQALQRVIGDKGTTALSVRSYSPDAMPANFHTGELDPHDFSRFGTQQPLSMAAAFGHEVMEQYGRQVLGMTDYTSAHAFAVGFENTFTGWVRGPHDTQGRISPGIWYNDFHYTQGDRKVDVRMIFNLDTANIRSVTRSDVP